MCYYNQVGHNKKGGVEKMADELEKQKEYINMLEDLLYLRAGEKKPTKKNEGSKIIKANKKPHSSANLEQKFSIGDSVMIYPDKKIGIVCEPVNDKGILRVQLPDKKIYINHKRVKLHVKADELYPEDYDFSIVFDTVENRKTRHEMSRKLTDKVITYDE